MRLARLHWEAWLLRLVLAGILASQLATRNTDGALVAGEGLLVSLLPLLVERLARTHVPRALELAFVLGMAFQFTSESLKLFEVFTYWDKLVHPTLVALAAMIAGWLLLGYRDAFGARPGPLRGSGGVPLATPGSPGEPDAQGSLSVHLVGLIAMLLGMSIGAMWEFVEFASDWFGNADLQKSTADTMTDILANDLGAFLATLLGLWIYHHRLDPRQHQELGTIARWLASGPSRIVDWHGRSIGAAIALAFAAVLGAALWIDRDPPPLATDLASGESRQWRFVSQDPASDALPLAGEWVPDSRGTCRVNLEHPRPGSEKMGLLELAPGRAYGADGQPVFIQTRYVEERPPKSEGTQMDAGIAFGIRDASNFYLLEASALHDIVRLDRYIHGKRRDAREKLVRTHGNEWHTLGVALRGDSVAALIDGEEVYRVANLPDTAGGIGLWARASAASCFSEASVMVGEGAPSAARPTVPGW